MNTARTIPAGIKAGVRTLGVMTALAYLAALVWLLWWIVVAVAIPGWTPVVITSGSMAPAIRAGDVVVAAQVAPQQLGAGVVVVFDDHAGGLMTHRIVDQRADGSFTTRGDANAVADAAPVVVDQLVGRGRLLVPTVGRPLVWVHGQHWLPLAIWATVTLAAVVAVHTWWRGAAQITTATTREPTERQLELIAFAWGGPPR